MRKNIIIILLIAISLILGRMLISNLDKLKTANQRKNSSTPAVTIATVETRDVVKQFEAPARIVAKYRVSILARISGYLTKSYFKEGDYVKAGQVLFEIEPQEFQYAASRAKANLDNAVAQADYYQKQLTRYEELVKQDFIAKSEYDNVLAQSNAYSAQVDSAMSAYRDAQRNLGYTKVKAPVDGKVGIINVTVGNFVSMSSGALTTINSSNPIYITFPLDSKDFSELNRIDKAINVNRKVEYIFSDGHKYELEGVQDFHDNKVDETTGTITLRATFDNPKDELIQGDFGRIIIYSNSTDKAPIIPQSASMENQEGKYVYLLDDKGLPRITYIKTSGQTSDGHWIVSEGIKEGDTLITSGIQKIIPGKPVRVISQEAQKAEATKKVSFWNKLTSIFKK